MTISGGSEPSVVDDGHRQRVRAGVLDAHVDQPTDQLRRRRSGRACCVDCGPTRVAHAASPRGRHAMGWVEPGRPALRWLRPPSAGWRRSRSPPAGRAGPVAGASSRSRGTSSVRRAAGVPGRGEKAAANTCSKRTWRSSVERVLELRVRLATETDDDVGREDDARDGVRSLSTSSRYASIVYCRPIRCSTASSPDCTGRWRCSHTDGHSAIAAISRSERSHGCDVTKRRRGMAGTPSAVRNPSIARSKRGDVRSAIELQAPAQVARARARPRSEPRPPGRGRTS